MGNEYAEAYEVAAGGDGTLPARCCVHAYDQPEVVAGQGTLGLELLEQLDGFDTVLVAVGGGGLIAGIATAIGDMPGSSVSSPSWRQRCTARSRPGEPVDVQVGGMRGGLAGARRLGDLAFEAVRAYAYRRCSSTRTRSLLLATSCGTSTTWPSNTAAAVA